MALRRGAVAALCAALALVAVGCGQDDERVEAGAPDFTVELPAGWEEGDADTREEVGETGIEEFGDEIGVSEDAQFAIDVQAVWAQAEPVDGVTTNINVFREELNGVSPSDYFAISEQQLRAATGFVTGAGPLLEGPSVGGEPSRTVDYSAAPAQGQTARLRLVTVIRGGAAYNITLTASPGAFESAASDLDAIIASWSWN